MQRGRTEYLVLWMGWPKESAQWTDEHDISSKLIRLVYKLYTPVLVICNMHNRKFDHPQPPDSVIRQAVGNFTSAIDKTLRKLCITDTKLKIQFRHDVYRFLFNDKKELVLDDFDERYFPLGWNQCCKKHGRDDPSYYGHTIVFPLEVDCYLQWTGRNSFIKLPDGTVRQKHRTFLEMLSIKLVKENL